MIDKYKGLKKFLDRNSDKCADDFANASEYFMFCNMKQMYEDIEQLQQENKQLKVAIDKAIEKLNSFIGCCKAEKLESGSDYLHHQYWNMFENFNKKIKDILKEGKND